MEDIMYQNRTSKQQYAQYSSIKERNCVGVGCIPPQQFQGIISSIKQHKAQSLYNRSKLPQLDLEEQSIQYQQWQKEYQQSIRMKLPTPFESSVHRFFRSRLIFIMIFDLIGIFCHCFTPFLLYLLYKNIVNQQVHSNNNKIVVALIIICRILRTICSYYAELKLNELGLKMYRLVTNAIIQKSLQCSPLSNKNISMKQLTKIMQTDCMTIMGYPATLAMGLDNTLNQIISTGIIIYVSGMAGLFGILFLFINLFLRLLLKKQVDSIGKTLENLSNDRVKATIQIFNIIKFIKANALQSCYFNKLRQLRVKEVAQIKKKLFIQTIQNAAHITKFLALVVTCKILVATGAPFDVEIVFTVCICISFTNPQGIINAVAYLDTIQTSFNYIETFMQQQNLNTSHIKANDDMLSRYSIQIQNGSFSWNTENDQSGEMNVNHLTNLNLEIKKGELIAIVGGYGSGKSSLVNCIIGEMNKKGDPTVTINGSIAYASQVPWIMNDTIRNNILFGSQYNETRYKQAVKYSSLQPDLQLFANGDLTIIGKRGSTLSGGQRARVSLARAFYSNADTYILDDILSAVDAQVGAFIFSMGIKRYLKKKTVILITHSLYYVSHADRILLFQNGQISASGTYQQVRHSPLFAKIETSALRTSKQYESILNKVVNIKQFEQIQQTKDQMQRQIGAMQSFNIYIKRNSGLPFALLIIIYLAIISGVSAYSQINLYGWSLSPVAQDDLYFYIQIIINVFIVSLTILLGLVLHFSKIYQSLHDDMIKSLLFSPLSYFQKVPTDKIINRVSNDLGINDKIITSEFNYSLVHFRIFFCALFNIFYVYVHFNNYFYFIVFTVFIAITIYLYSNFSGLSNKIRKLQKELIIPINGKYTEILDGLPVIRAYNKIQYMTKEFQSKVNIYSMAATIRSIIAARILLVIFISTNILAIIKVLSLLYLDDSFSNYSIFLIFNIFSLQDGMMKVNQNVTVFGPVLDSLGKCEDLTKLEHQKGFDEYLNNNWNEDGPFQNVYFGKQIFPRGQIIFDHFSLRYKPDQQDVLKSLSFIISPGEKIGIVGRTGSGKSTLMLGLLRIIEGSSGRIIIDGMETKKLSLQQLRSNINIILQDHFLFTGTIRENVDPTGAHTDQQVENAIKLCGIWQGFNDGLDTKVTQGGDNLSSGQKQLINIARSLLSPKRIVLVDEATASIDIQTDELIQKVIKTQFADRTVLTIAHRINTVVESDRILVLGNGSIVQFDTPQNLLQKQTSIFAKLYKESGKTKEE